MTRSGTAPVYLPAWMVTQDQGIPAVCCRHGAPAVRRQKVRFYSKPPLWALLFLLLGVIPLLLALLIIRRTVVAPAWPFCARCQQERRTRLRNATLVGLVGPLVLIAPLFVVDASEDGVALAVIVSFGLMLAGIVMAGRAGWSALHRLTVTRDGASLIIDEPARAFVAALPPAPVPPGAVLHGAAAPVPQA